MPRAWRSLASVCARCTHPVGDGNRMPSPWVRSRRASSRTRRARWRLNAYERDYSSGGGNAGTATFKSVPQRGGVSRRGNGPDAHSGTFRDVAPDGMVGVFGGGVPVCAGGKRRPSLHIRRGDGAPGVKRNCGCECRANRGIAMSRRRIQGERFGRRVAEVQERKAAAQRTGISYWCDARASSAVSCRSRVGAGCQRTWPKENRPCGATR